MILRSQSLYPEVGVESQKGPELSSQLTKERGRGQQGESDRK